MKKSFGLFLIFSLLVILMTAPVFAENSAIQFPIDKLPLTVKDLKSKFPWASTPAAITKGLGTLTAAPNTYKEDLADDYWNNITLTCNLDDNTEVEYYFSFFSKSLTETRLTIRAKDVKNSPDQTEVDRAYELIKSQLPVAQMHEDNTTKMAEYIKKTFYRAESWKSNTAYYFLMGHRAGTLPAFIQLQMDHAMTYQFLGDSIFVLTEQTDGIADGQHDATETPMATEATTSNVSQATALPETPAMPGDISQADQNTLDTQNMVTVPMSFPSDGSDPFICFKLTDVKNVFMTIDYDRTGTTTSSPFLLVIKTSNPGEKEHIFSTESAFDYDGKGSAMMIGLKPIKDPGRYCVYIKSNGYKSKSKDFKFTIDNL